MANAIPMDDKRAMMMLEHELKMVREEQRHKHSMEELRLMAEARIREYRRE